VASDMHRFSPGVRTFASAFCAALFLTGAAPPRAPIDLAAQLNGLVRAALSQAPVNFAAWRNGQKSVDKDGVTFKASAAMKKLCPVCNLADEYASANTDERFTVMFDWLVPKSWPRAQVLAYVQQNIGALLPTYSAQQGTNDSGESWYDWSKAASHEFVYVETYSSKTQNGFEVRVGHYLPKNLHYTLYARLSATQLDTLAKAVRNFVQLGVQNGSDNFMSLRGRATDKDNNYFDTNVSFGEFLKTCDVDGIFANESAGGGTSKWMLECDTPPLGGAKSDIEAALHSAIVAALPGGFTPTTDPTYLGLSDYRWDRSSDTIAVEISSYDNHDGTYDYHVEIYHFTT